jgi:NADH:ubiquinone oxidoreductase subunit F (NADH-binding)
MVNMAKFFIEIYHGRSCGKCAPAGSALPNLQAVAKFVGGEATEQDLVDLENLCEMVKETSLCGLGKMPHPVLSTLKYFRMSLRTRSRKISRCRLRSRTRKKLTPEDFPFFHN